MKAKVIMLMVALVSMALNLNARGGYSYVITTTDTIYCSRIQFGFSDQAKCIMSNGQIQKVGVSNICCYYKNGRLYERKPLYKRNKPANKDVFMEVIAYRNGMKLYKYCTSEVCMDSPLFTGMYTRFVPNLMVFKGEKFVVNVTEKNVKTVMDYFTFRDTAKKM